MRRAGSLWQMAVMAMVAAPGWAGEAGGGSTGPETGSDLVGGQVLIECRFVELPSKEAQAFFGAADPATLATGTAVVTDEMWERLAARPGVKILSAPRVITVLGQSVQMFTGQEYPYSPGFELNSETGSWEPAPMQTKELGIKLTCMPSAHPEDPRRLFGAIEVSLSDLVEERHERLTVPGRGKPLEYTLPVIATRTMTATVCMPSGQMIVLGGLDGSGPKDATVVVILVRMTSEAAISIWVPVTGDITVGGQHCAPAELSARIGGEARLRPRAEVVIRAAAGADFARVTSVVDACRTAGIEQLSITTGQ